MDSTCNTPAQKAFMELVCRGIDGKMPDESIFTGLSAGEWEEIYTLARRQTVCGICYEAYCKLPDRLLPEGSLLPRWVARVNAIETQNRAMSEALAELVKILRGLGLHPVVQKGLSVARFYPHPELRECGDIDLWLSESEMEHAVAFARKNNIALKSHADGSLSFIFRGFIVELHRHLINISAPGAARKLESFAVSECGRKVDFEGNIPSPTPLLELLLINVHIMRHVFGTGIGLRQVCDYMCAAYSLQGKYDPAEFERLCVALGISRWTALLNDFLVRYLGAAADKLPPSGLKKSNAIPVESLMKIIMDGGNFGHHPVSAEDKADTVAGGKMHTLSMLLKRSRFAFSVAPSQAFWNFVKLSLGQLH